MGAGARAALVALLSLTPVTGAVAQAPPAAQPSDVESLDAIMGAVYDVISGPAGQARDWDRFRSLFAPGAQLIPTVRNQQGEIVALRLSVEDYVARAGASLEESGFFEIESYRVAEQFGNIAHAFSTYESRRAADDPEPFARGINSFQLLHDGDRWWVVNIFWVDERTAGPIPAKYLPQP